MAHGCRQAGDVDVDLLVAGQARNSRQHGLKVSVEVRDRVRLLEGYEIFQRPAIRGNAESDEKLVIEMSLVDPAYPSLPLVEPRMSLALKFESHHLDSLILWNAIELAEPLE